MSGMFIARIGLLIATTVLATPVGGDTVTLNPAKDNTLIEDATGSLSNALGSIFCGRTGPFGGLRSLRLVMMFDVAAGVPTGSTINSASILLRLEQTSSGDQTHALHRLLADWGEGTSLGVGGGGAPATTGDATWLHTSFSTQVWTMAGGDFVSTGSASQTVGADAFNDYVWSSAQLAADVQEFLDRPPCNFGWLMRGNEAANNTSKKFHSRHAVDEALRPRLVIDFTPPAAPCPADTDNNGAINVNDLLAVITSWGACQPCPAACAADVSPAPAGDQQVNVNDLLLVITTWGTCK